MYGLHEYGKMLADEVRVRAYLGALEAVVRKGSVVLDLGTGPGLFALEAARLGARRVYAVDPDPIIELGREAAAASGLSHLIEFIEADSETIDLPERADVMVSDIRGALPLFGSHLPTLIDARTRHLRQGGVLIPSQDELLVAVVEAKDRYQGHVDPWTRHLGNAQTALSRVRHTWFGSSFRPEDLLCAPKSWATLDYATVTNPNVESAHLSLPILRGGEGHGLGVWFVARLPGSFQYATGPTGDIPLATIYSAAFFPWLWPVRLDEGDVVTVRLGATLVDEDYQWQWDSAVRAKDGALKAEHRQSTFYASAFSMETLRRRDAAHVPSLGKSGQRLRFVLGLMDGSHPLEEIAQRLARAFPTEFRSLADAMSYVGRLSQKYGG
jgi:SAM-dependent methyltransferase